MFPILFTEITSTQVRQGKILVSHHATVLISDAFFASFPVLHIINLVPAYADLDLPLFRGYTTYACIY